MRPIKFRAYCPGHGMTEVFDLIDLYGYAKFVCSDGTDITNCLFKDPLVSIMQYTGLHDCNGKEIYEGDILTNKLIFFSMGEYEVIFKFGSFGYELREQDGSNPELIGLTNEEFEIIGNIHENPELLEKL